MYEHACPIGQHHWDKIESEPVSSNMLGGRGVSILTLDGILAVIGKFYSSLETYIKHSDKEKRRPTIDFSMLELPRRHPIVEEQIDLSKSPVFGLGQTEPAPDIAEQVGSSVEERGLSSPVPCYRQHRVSSHSFLQL